MLPIYELEGANYRVTIRKFQGANCACKVYFNYIDTCPLPTCNISQRSLSSLLMETTFIQYQPGVSWKH